MKNFVTVLRWKFSTYETKKDILLFNKYICFGTHYKGIKSYCLEFLFTGGIVILSKRGLTYLGKNFEPKIEKYGKLESFKIRIGRPILTFHFCEKSRNKSIEALNRYKVN
jgi:hypothetical protein